jgi:hypothetical protein
MLYAAVGLAAAFPAEHTARAALLRLPEAVGA